MLNNVFEKMEASYWFYDANPYTKIVGKVNQIMYLNTLWPIDDIESTAISQ